MLGDYYPLTPYSLELDHWIAWQFNRPVQSDGVIQVFRRAQCADATQTYRLNGIDPAAQYKVTNFDLPDTLTISGKALLEQGLIVEITECPGAAVITYHRSTEKGSGSQ
jgi:hypothetical protein